VWILIADSDYSVRRISYHWLSSSIGFFQREALVHSIIDAISENNRYIERFFDSVGLSTDAGLLLITII